MLPRLVAVVIALAATVVVLVNVGLQAFGLGDSAIYVMYPAVLGALGLTVKQPADLEAFAGGRAAPAADDGTPPPPTSIDARTARHRSRGER